MTAPLKIVGIAGSLRAASFSHIVLASIAQQLPAGTVFDTVDIGALPHYNEDIERDALPESVMSARGAVQAADAVIIVSPEFNHGIPGVLKNTLDWLSRPAFTSAMQHKHVMFATLSPGALGGVRAQYQLRETLASMLCRFVPMGEIAITHIGAKVNGGELTDAPTLDFLGGKLHHFLGAVASENARQPSQAL